MIATDGRRTAANYWPPHGGYPGETAQSDTLRDDRPPLPRVEWATGIRTDVTFSLPGDGDETDHAARAALAALAAHGQGCTLSQHGVGIWKGEREYCRTLSLVGVGTAHPATLAAIAALHGAGCVAVQVETIGGPHGYTCGEYRAP